MGKMGARGPHPELWAVYRDHILEAYPQSKQYAEEEGNLVNCRSGNSEVGLDQGPEFLPRGCYGYH